MDPASRIESVGQGSGIRSSWSGMGPMGLPSTATGFAVFPCSSGVDFSLLSFCLSLSLCVLIGLGTLHPVLLAGNFVDLSIFGHLLLWLGGDHSLGNDWDQPQVLYHSSCVSCLFRLMGDLLSTLIYHLFILKFLVVGGCQGQSLLEFALGKRG